MGVKDKDRGTNYSDPLEPSIIVFHWLLKTMILLMGKGIPSLPQRYCGLFPFVCTVQF